MPRVLFPDKSYMSDSSLVEEYAGLRVNADTSIGLSFVAEGYIDLGTTGVVVVSLFAGFIMGAAGGFLIRLSPWKPLGNALAISMAMGTYGFGPLLLKLIGHRFTVSIVWTCLLAILGVRIRQWITGWPERSVGRGRACRPTAAKAGEMPDRTPRIP
jgi:hypothetical protein